MSAIRKGTALKTVHIARTLIASVIYVTLSSIAEKYRTVTWP